MRRVPPSRVSQICFSHRLPERLPGGAPPKHIRRAWNSGLRASMPSRSEFGPGTSARPHIVQLATPCMRQLQVVRRAQFGRRAQSLGESSFLHFRKPIVCGFLAIFLSAVPGQWFSVGSISQNATGLKTHPPAQDQRNPRGRIQAQNFPFQGGIGGASSTRRSPGWSW